MTSRAPGANRTRAGAILAELALALLLAGVAAVIGGGILVAAERRTRRDLAADRAAQVVRDVAHLLSSEITGALPDSVAVLGDTALDLHAHVGASVVCARAAGSVVLPGAATSSGNPFTFWSQQAEPADLLQAWDSSGGGRWQPVAVDSVVSVANGAGCTTASGFRSVADSVARIATTRLFHSTPLPPGVVVGAPVRVFRPVRWVLYRGSDRRWSLGYRRCPRAACGSTVQPAAGPLAAAADSGLRFTAMPAAIIVVAIRPATQTGVAAAPATITVAMRDGSHVRP